MIDTIPCEICGQQAKAIFRVLGNRPTCGHPGCDEPAHAAIERLVPHDAPTRDIAHRCEPHTKALCDQYCAEGKRHHVYTLDTTPHADADAIRALMKLAREEM